MGSTGLQSGDLSAAGGKPIRHVPLLHAAPPSYQDTRQVTSRNKLAREIVTDADRTREIRDREQISS